MGHGIVRYLFIVVLALQGCASRGVLLVNPEGMEIGDIQPVYYATSRARGSDGLFGSDLSQKLSYGQSFISIPPVHVIGNIEWPKSRPDPAQFFVVAQENTFTGGRAFSSSMAQDFQNLPTSDRTAVVFVHGFNNNFAEGLFTLAQLSHDFEIPGIAVHYAWPSAAQPLGYLHDRDSTLYARDGLEELLGAVQAAGAERILLVGHSMGAMLVMETMRQISLRNPYHLNQSQIGVTLISPDIDVDIFSRQVERISPTPMPFYVYTSQTDRPLRLSGMLAVQSERLGRVTDLEKLSHIDITLIELSEFDIGGSGHFILGSSSALIKVMSLLNGIDQRYFSGETARSGLLPGERVTIGNATRIVLHNVENN